MSARWGILALLFGVRAVMAFQFQAVAALSPFMMETFAVGLAETGLMIGLYLAPGIFVALPGGALGQRFGEKEVVTAGLCLMAVGGVLMAAGDSWGAHLSGRLMAGIGGVLLNVLMTKMLVDWFRGREIATAMAVFINSWPVGIALALLILPPLADEAGYRGAMWAVAGLAILALLLFPLTYRSPGRTAAMTDRAWPVGPVMAGVLAAGFVWGLYNAAVAMVFGFGTALLAEQGRDVAEAAAMTSLVLWSMAVSTPLGGVLADRTGRPGAVILAGVAALALTFWIAQTGGAAAYLFAMMGFAAGLPAGPIMALPGRLLGPAAAATGMGLFFTVYYVLMLVMPWAVGWAADRAGSAAVAFDAAIGLLALTGLCFLFYCRAARALSAPKREGRT